MTFKIADTIKTVLASVPPAPAPAAVKTVGQLMDEAEALFAKYPPAPAPASTVAAPAVADPVVAELPKPASTPNPAIHLDLQHILKQPRGHGGKKEKEFHSWLIRKLNTLGHKPTLRAEQCITVEIAADMVNPTPSKVLFSCHIDTVHGSDVVVENKLMYDPSMGHIALLRKPVADGPLGKYARTEAWGQCLGADDGAGVWLMLQMIEARVPGGYIFHRGEEKHGVGSHAMVASAADALWLKGFDAAIAFDRADGFEVITTQGGQRCASEAFGNALADALTKGDKSETFKYETSAKGTFTDTKVYRNIIAECVNLGVGYQNQHGPDEFLDYEHLLKMRDALLVIDWSALPISRDPKVVEAGGTVWENTFRRSNTTPFSRGILPYDDNIDDDFRRTPPPAYEKPKVTVPSKASVPTAVIDSWLILSKEAIAEYLAENSDTAALELIDLVLEAVSYRAKYEALKSMIEAE